MEIGFVLAWCGSSRREASSPSPCGRGVGVRANEVHAFELPWLSPHPRWRSGSMVLRYGFSISSRWHRWPRGPYFLCLCKESKQRKHTPAVRPPLRGGCAVPAGIFVRGILPRPKTAHILVRRPCGVLPAGTAGPQGAQQPKQKRPRARTLLLLASGPHEARRVGRVEPEGRRHG